MTISILPIYHRCWVNKPWSHWGQLQNRKKPHGSIFTLRKHSTTFLFLFSCVYLFLKVHKITWGHKCQLQGILAKICFYSHGHFLAQIKYYIKYSTLVWKVYRFPINTQGNQERKEDITTPTCQSSRTLDKLPFNRPGKSKPPTWGLTHQSQSNSLSRLPDQHLVKEELWFKPF